VFGTAGLGIAAVLVLTVAVLGHTGLGIAAVLVLAVAVLGHTGLGIAAAVAASQQTVLELVFAVVFVIAPLMQIPLPDCYLVYMWDEQSYYS